MSKRYIIDKPLTILNDETSYRQVCIRPHYPENHILFFIMNKDYECEITWNTLFKPMKHENLRSYAK